MVGYVRSLVSKRESSEHCHSEPLCFETNEGKPERCHETSWEITVLRCDHLKGGGGEMIEVNRVKKISYMESAALRRIGNEGPENG